MSGMLPSIFLAGSKVQVCAKPLFQAKYEFSHFAIFDLRFSYVKKEPADLSMS